MNMNMNIEPIDNLARQLSRLPGIGSKTAQRLAYFIIDMTKEEVAKLAEAAVQAKEQVHYCSICGHYTTGETCGICVDPNRSSEVLCVVRDPRDVLALERTRDFKGRYHVLHGVLSPMDGIGPDDLRIQALVDRLQREDVREVILATNPDVEGEATAAYLAKILKPYAIAITRIAHGIPIGGNLEYIDELTLQQALAGRREM